MRRVGSGLKFLSLFLGFRLNRVKGSVSSVLFTQWIQLGATNEIVLLLKLTLIATLRMMMTGTLMKSWRMTPRSLLMKTYRRKLSEMQKSTD